MKILLVGSKHKTSIEKMYFEAFKSQKKKIFFLNFKSFIEFNLIEKIFFKLFPNFFSFTNFKKLKKELINKNITHLILFNSGNLEKYYLEYLKKNYNYLYLINILSDNPFWNIEQNQKENVKKELILYDQVFSWSQDIIKTYRKKNMQYLPFAFSNKYKNILGKKKIIEKVLFFGSWDKDREQIISKIDPKYIDIFGNNWRKANSKFKQLYNINYFELAGYELSKKIQKYLICLNLIRPQVKNSHNMRSFEVLGNGGILLSKSTLEHKKLFKKKIRCVFFKNEKDINQKIKFILLNKKKLIKMKFKSRKFYENQTYFFRTKKILDKIQ